MFKTLLKDRETIENKYHLQSQPYNHYDRWSYHGYDFDPETGLDDAGIDAGLSKLTKELWGEPRPIHKARLVEYVLDNTRIDINEHDYFIGIYTLNRPLRFHCINKWRDDIYAKHPEKHEVLKNQDEAGACYGWLDFDHTVPDWDSIAELGFSGILARAGRIRDDLKEKKTLTPKQEAFYKAIEIEYKAIIRMIDRLYKYALTKNHEKAPKIAECLMHLRDGAPTDTYEMLQLIYIYFMISEHIDGYQVRSLGYGLDQTLLPFYKKDIESGRYTKKEIGEFIGYFLMQWQAIDNYWGQPVYLGGMFADGTTQVNELSYLILDVYDKLGLYNPKIQIKTNGTTPKDFVLKALEMVRHGVNSIVFVNNDTATKCLMKSGYTYEQAVDVVMSGCYEYKVKGKGIGISCCYPNALKAVSLVFDNGLDTVTGKQIGIKTGELCEFDTFEKFYAAYREQYVFLLKDYLDSLFIFEANVQDINPSMLYSAANVDCVTTLTDALDNGIENVTGVTMSGLGSAVDALMAVHDLVYDRKACTLEELKAVLDADWGGYEKLRLKALNLKNKYGNGSVMADYYANAITKLVSDYLGTRTNGHGCKVSLELHSARAFVIEGERTKATPDGRKKGQETSKNASPSPGADRNGITALINSATTIEPTLANVGFCLDAMLHPSAVQGDDGLEALYSVLDTYHKKGGASIHFNIFDAKILRDAQEHPEKYKNLQVRVCGWNILWNSMDKKEQDAYILRAENIV